MPGFLSAIIFVGGSVVFILAIGAGALRHIIVILLVLLRELRERGKKREAVSVPVTVLIATHNEEKSICTAIKSVLASTYPSLQVLIVDDGSTDGTQTLVEQTFGNNNRVQVLSAPNKGKLSALRQGLQNIHTEFVVTMDADTTFRPETIGELMTKFDSDQIAAVSGNIKVLNQAHKISRYQALEYVTLNFDRRALDLFEAVPVIPGAVGAWRSNLLTQALADVQSSGDVEMTLTTLHAGYRIPFAEKAVAYTQAPTELKELFSQRRRWAREKWLVIKRCAWRIIKQHKGYRDLIAASHVITVHGALPLLLWWIDIFILIRIAQATVALNFTTPAFLGTLKLYLFFIALECLRTGITLSLEEPEDKKLMRVCIQKSIFSRQMNGLAAFCGLFLSHNKSTTKWQHVKRNTPTQPSQTQDPPPNDSPPEAPAPDTY